MKCCSLAIGWQTVLAQRPKAPTVTVMDAMGFSVRVVILLPAKTVGGK